jgi:hypothetical protein
LSIDEGQRRADVAERCGRNLCAVPVDQSDLPARACGSNEDVCCCTFDPEQTVPAGRPYIKKSIIDRKARSGITQGRLIRIKQGEFHDRTGARDSDGPDRD